MSTAAGIAAVTAVLKDLLVNGLIDHEAAAAVGDVTVTAQAPDRIKLPEEKSQLNLFLYLVTPNSGWRNVGLPSRDGNGELVSAPPLAIDLHYLLSAYGTKDFHAEILLGYAMRLLHEMPLLTRAAIRNALSPSLLVNGNGGAIPPDLKDLFQSGLAEQIEQIKITPTYLTTEEMFKLWMAFQAPYRPTAAYHVSVVLIESQHQGKVAMPVRERNLYATPFSQPVIEQVLSQSAAGQPFLPNQRILAIHRLALLGKNLAGSSIQVLVSGQQAAINQLQMTDARLEFPLPAGLLSGVQSVRVVRLIDIGSPPSPHTAVESNVAAFVLSPVLSNVIGTVTSGQAGPAAAERSGNITADIGPGVGKRQRVTLLLNELNPPSTRSARAYRFECTSHSQPAAPDLSPSLTFSFTGVLPADYLVRVHVDGGESPLEIDATGQFIKPKVSIT